MVGREVVKAQGGEVVMLTLGTTLGMLPIMMKVDAANWKEMALTTLTKGRM